MTADLNLGGKRPDRVAAIVEERDAYAEQLDRATSGFPSYEVPEFVRERFPQFDPTDPSTWPEPDRCTEGRPWGHDAYPPGSVLGRDMSDRWRRRLAAAERAAAAERPSRYRDPDLGCRNRWKHEDSRLCGTHDRSWRDAIEHARKRVRRNARELEHLDLARQLGAYGIEADGFPDSVRLQADAVRELLRILDPLHGAGL